MPKMSGMLLYHKLRNIDPNLLFCFITADKEYIQHLKKSIAEIEKIVIYKPILLSDLRRKVNSLLSERKSKLLIMPWRRYFYRSIYAFNSISILIYNRLWNCIVYDIKFIQNQPRMKGLRLILSEEEKINKNFWLKLLWCGSMMK